MSTLIQIQDRFRRFSSSRSRSRSRSPEPTVLRSSRSRSPALTPTLDIQSSDLQEQDQDQKEIVQEEEEVIPWWFEEFEFDEEVGEEEDIDLEEQSWPTEEGIPETPWPEEGFFSQRKWKFLCKKFRKFRDNI